MMIPLVLGFGMPELVLITMLLSPIAIAVVIVIIVRTNRARRPPTMRPPYPPQGQGRPPGPPDWR